MFFYYVSFPTEKYRQFGFLMVRHNSIHVRFGNTSQSRDTAGRALCRALCLQVFASALFQEPGYTEGCPGTAALEARAAASPHTGAAVGWNWVQPEVVLLG